MPNGVSAEMPRYKCHKEVHALKIDAVVPNPDTGGAGLTNEEGFAPILVSKEWRERHLPQAGGYYVVYADGYTSFSPAEAFEAGYYRIP